MPSFFRNALDWIRLTRLTAGLSQGEARAIRITGTVQITMTALPSLLLLTVFVAEPPETHMFSLIHFFLLILPLAFARFLIWKRKQTAAAILTLGGVNYHLGALAAAQADDPAPLGFLITAILPFLMIPRGREKTRWALAIFAMAGFLGFQFYYRVYGGQAIFGPPRWVVPADYLMPPLVLLEGFLILIVYQFVKAVNTAEDLLTLQNVQSEKLLLNILPADVAKELKQNGVSRPRHFASATVCFTDFQGFTKIAETLTPTELVDELDRCFSYFDSLMERHNLEKLKTIGDSYMFAGGIPRTNKTHAVDCVMAALEIQAFMNQMKEIKSANGLPFWELRLGIHSGDIVAGVIGEKKFAYDVWSDTVNTASRCESSGVAGKINISRATYELVKDFFLCEYRGEVPAKHKGSIEMYFVQGLLPELQRVDQARTPNSEFEKRYAALGKGAAAGS